MKLLIIGLDGAAYLKIMKFNCLYLKKLCSEYQHGILRSDDEHGCNVTGEPWTGPAWNTVYTGVDATIHGVGVSDWASGNTATLQSSAPTIFDVLGKDYTLGLMTMPALFPTSLPIKNLNGWAITGFPAEDNVKEMWKYPADLDVPSDFIIENHHRCHIDEHFEEAMAQVTNKIRLATELFQQHKTQVGAIGIQYLDFVDHSTITGMAAPYEFIDNAVKGLLESIKPDNFIICSDHGFKIRDTVHSQEGFYACSIPGEYRERTIFDIAPLALWITKR